MKRSIEPATPSTSRAGRFTTAQVLSMLDSDNENELLNDVDYASDEIASSSESVPSDPSNVNTQSFLCRRTTDRELGTQNGVIAATVALCS